MSKFNLGDEVQFSQYGTSYTGIVTQFSWYSGGPREHTYVVRVQRPDALGCEMQYWEAHLLEGELIKVESEHPFVKMAEEELAALELRDKNFQNNFKHITNLGDIAKIDHMDALRYLWNVIDVDTNWIKFPVPKEYHDGCQHEFVEYVGLTNRFNYCKKCDLKQ